MTEAHFINWLCSRCKKVMAKPRMRRVAVCQKCQHTRTLERQREIAKLRLLVN